MVGINGTSSTRMPGSDIIEIMSAITAINESQVICLYLQLLAKVMTLVKFSMNKVNFNVPDC
jgi:hypothetical protein